MTLKHNVWGEPHRILNIEDGVYVESWFPLTKDSAEWYLMLLNEFAGYCKYELVEVPDESV